MFIAKTDYTLNRKNKGAIVCKTAVDSYVLLKQEDFASEEEFEKWKAWSDEDYHISELLRCVLCRKSKCCFELLGIYPTRTLKNELLELPKALCGAALKIYFIYYKFSAL